MMEVGGRATWYFHPCLLFRSGSLPSVQGCVMFLLHVFTDVRAGRSSAPSLGEALVPRVRLGRSVAVKPLNALYIFSIRSLFRSVCRKLKNKTKTNEQNPYTSDFGLGVVAK